MADFLPQSPELQRKATPLTVTSRATFAFNQSILKKPEIEHESPCGEPYGPHDVTTKDSEVETDFPRRRGSNLVVPRQRSKLKASR